MKKIVLLVLSIACLLILTPHSFAANIVDVDCDGVDDKIDNCPKDTNPSQTDWDRDGKGDVCDTSGCPKTKGWVEGETCGCIDTLRYMTDPWKFLRETGTDPIATQAKKLVARFQIVQQGSGFNQSFRGLGYFWYYSNKLKTWMYIMPWNGGLKIWNAANWANNKNGTEKDIYVAQLGGGTDACGICSGDTSSCSDCKFIPNGNAVKDSCGICGGDGSSCMVPRCNGHIIEITRYMNQPTKLLQEVNSNIPAARQAFNLVKYYKLIQKGSITANRVPRTSYNGMYWYYSEKIAETMPNMAWLYVNPMSGVINLFDPTHQGGPDNDVYIAQLGGGTDACGICEGYGSTCADCKGIPNGTAKKDSCGVCAGDGSSCGFKCDFYKVERVATNLPFGCQPRYLRTTIKVEKNAADPKNPLKSKEGRTDTGYMVYWQGPEIQFGKGSGTDMYMWHANMKNAMSTLMLHLREKFCKAKKDLPVCTTHLERLDWYRTYNDRSWPQAFTFVMDKLGNPIVNPTTVQKDKACLLYTVTETSKGSGGCSSPVSFIWNNNETQKGSTVVDFSIADNPQQGWSEWRASSELPLLVYDPEHKGKIESAQQLFGSWTFGGKNMSSINSKLTPHSLQDVSWNDGYEPMALLDSDANQVLESQELDHLGLWFDKNKDAISQSGEVKTLKELNVSKVFYKNAVRNKLTNDLELKIGYERIVDGKTLIGKSIDWFPAVGTSKAEVEAHLNATK